MEHPITASNLNDFTFCPYSIFIHSMYEDMPKKIYQGAAQIRGTYAHIDAISSSIGELPYEIADDIKNIIKEETFYSSTYDIITVIDFYNSETRTLAERKNTIKYVYPGYTYQIYAQYFALKDNGLIVDKLILHSLSDGITYSILLPEVDQKMKNQFEQILHQIRHFDISAYYPDNIEKCTNCIYNSLCDRSLND